MRYIDADMFKYNIESASKKMHSICGIKGVDIGAVLKAVDMFPTADVVEVVHGSFEWIADDSPMCNICGKVFDTNDDADAGLWKFCPECGAKMDGERSKNE